MRELLSPSGSVMVDNGTILNAMFDIVEREVGGQPTTTPQTAQTTLSPSMMRNSGKALALDKLYAFIFIMDRYILHCFMCAWYVLWR